MKSCLMIVVAALLLVMSGNVLASQVKPADDVIVITSLERVR